MERTSTTGHEIGSVDGLAVQGDLPRGWKDAPDGWTPVPPMVTAYWNLKEEVQKLENDKETYKVATILLSFILVLVFVFEVVVFTWLR